MKYVIYDIETFQNLFTYTDINRSDNSVTQFVIHESRDDRKQFFEYLSRKLFMIGFNNLKFDYPVLFEMLSRKKYFLSVDIETATKEIYTIAQSVINAEYSKIPDWKEEKFKIRIPQLDLFAINHFDNAAKRTSLKDLEFYMRMENVESLPYKHDDIVDDVQRVLDYNLNDVKATYEFYKKNIDAIKLRVELSNQYKIDLLNANDPQLGSDIFVQFISTKTGQLVNDIKQQRTKRDKIHFGDLILPYVKYQSNEFNKLFEKIQNTVVTADSTFSERVVFDRFPYDFGVGGIHGCTYSGIYRPKNDEVIMTSDVTSYYPNLGIRNKRYPEHLGPVFCEVYEEIYDMRAIAKKAGLKAINEGLKLALNGVYGKSGDKYSPFYDLEYMYFITINGQLLLTMLSEKMQLQGYRPLMINTDGFEFIVPKTSEERYHELCTEWENTTQLQLEHDTYNLMAINNVNNYLAQTTSGKVKQKGLFETEKVYHKDTSFMIVPIALEQYIINNIPVEQTITNHKDIFDFCGKIRSHSGYDIEYRTLDIDKINIEKLQKINRVFISKSGGVLYKTNGERTEGVYVKRKATLFNKYFQADYDIDYDFYIKECYKILDEIEPKQLSLFQI